MGRVGFVGVLGEFQKLVFELDVSWWGEWWGEFTWGGAGVVAQKGSGSLIPLRVGCNMGKMDEAVEGLRGNPGFVYAKGCERIMIMQEKMMKVVRDYIGQQHADRRIPRREWHEQQRKHHTTLLKWVREQTEEGVVFEKPSSKCRLMQHGGLESILMSKKKWPEQKYQETVDWLKHKITHHRVLADEATKRKKRAVMNELEKALSTLKIAEQLLELSQAFSNSFITALFFLLVASSAKTL
jgi:hypothetical protein